MEAPTDQALPVNPQEMLEDLTEKITNFSISNSIQSQRQLQQHESHLDTSTLSESDSLLPIQLHFGLRNSTSVYQELILKMNCHNHQIPLVGAQQGLVFTATPEGNIVHWPL